MVVVDRRTGAVVMLWGCPSLAPSWFEEVLALGGRGIIEIEMKSHSFIENQRQSKYIKYK
jgi:hypothetical protein